MHQTTVTGHECRADERGSILVIVLFVSLAISGLIFAGGLGLGAARTQAETEFRVFGQARNVARAGLVDAFSWFRRQPSQPVSAFAPRRDDLADPPIRDTDDPAIGIVRSFRISGDIWGRYEVRHSDKDRRLTARDVSTLRRLPGTGQAWALAAVGTVYRNRDPNVAFDQNPNEVLGSARAFTEIRRITMSPPAGAAINATSASAVSLGARSRVIGNEGAGVAIPSGTGSVGTSGELSGTPGWTGIAASSFEISVSRVFGVPVAELKSLADEVVADPNKVPSPLPQEKLIVIEGNVTFDDARPLRGTGVLYVEGDLTIAASPLNFFNGLLYVDGDVTVRAPSVVRGSIVATGTVSVSGAGDYAEVEYDSGVLGALMLSMGQYRISKAIRFAE